MATLRGTDAAVAQFDHARSAVNTAMSGPHIGQRVHGRGLSVARADVGTPQVFTQHPLISSVNPNEVGLENYATNQALPVNPASWDGETSASAPAVTKAFEMFQNLSESQRKILLFGAPVVAVFALVSTLGKRNQAASTATPAATGTIPGTYAPSTDAIGVGQLSDFESMVSGAIAQLAQQVSTLPTTQEIQASLPAPIVNVAPTPAPAPAPTKTLTPLSSANFSVIAPQGSDMAVIGSAGGGQYNAGNLAGGAPLYALIDGRWIQNFGDPKSLTAGTSLATLGTLKDYVVF